MSVTISLRTSGTFAAGVAVAVIAAVVFHAFRADAAPGDTDSTFVTMTPCRLIDTRSGEFHVGPHETFGSADTKTIAARGDHGDCTIPSDAVGLSLNVTALGATAPSFLTIWPDGERPEASSLNPVPGQPPIPNAVTTTLSGAGSFDVFNLDGAVDVIIDVNGYHTKASLQDLDSRLSAVEAGVADNGAEIVALRARQALVVTAEEAEQMLLTTTPTEYVDVSLTAPSAGYVTLISTAVVRQDTEAGVVSCAIYESTQVPEDFILTATPSSQEFRTGGGGNLGSLSGSRVVEIDAGSTTVFSLACQENVNGGRVFAGNLSAIFTPAP